MLPQPLLLPNSGNVNFYSPSLPQPMPFPPNSGNGDSNYPSWPQQLPPNNGNGVYYSQGMPQPPPLQLNSGNGVFYGPSMPQPLPTSSGNWNYYTPNMPQLAPPLPNGVDYRQDLLVNTTGQGTVNSTPESKELSCWEYFLAIFLIIGYVCLEIILDGN